MIVRRALLAGRIGLLLLLGTFPALAQESSSSNESKIDRAVQESLRTDAATQHVIITVEPGFSSGIRQALEAHGDVVTSDHPLIGAFSAEIHSGNVRVLAQSPSGGRAPRVVPPQRRIPRPSALDHPRRRMA